MSRLLLHMIRLDVFQHNAQLRWSAYFTDYVATPFGVTVYTARLTAFFRFEGFLRLLLNTLLQNLMLNAQAPMEALENEFHQRTANLFSGNVQASSQ